MCVTLLAAVAVPIAISTTATLAQYSDARGIELHPIVCEWDKEAQMFAVFHEEAHEKHLHVMKRRYGADVKAQEIEADRYAIRRLAELGYDPCKGVKPVLMYRPEKSETHPSASELYEMACNRSQYQ